MREGALTLTYLCSFFLQTILHRGPTEANKVRVAKNRLQVPIQPGAALFIGWIATAVQPVELISKPWFIPLPASDYGIAHDLGADGCSAHNLVRTVSSWSMQRGGKVMERQDE